MKKKLRLVILIISLLILFFVINISLHLIEEHIETNVHNINIYNKTNEYIKIYINNKVVNVENNTFLMDKIFDNKKERIYDYKIEINGKIIMEKRIYFPSDECVSYSARGGTFTNVKIMKIDNINYDILFIGNFEPEINENIKVTNRKRIIDIFNRDKLNMN